MYTERGMKMDLYRIDVEHIGPKSIKSAIQCFLVSGNDKDVYEWIVTMSETYPKKDKFSWFSCAWAYDQEDFEDDPEESDYPLEVYDSDYNVISYDNSPRERVIRLCGDINDEDFDFTDSYYGLSRYGWVLLCPMTWEEIHLLGGFIGETLFIDPKVI
jgi:hypothetical protein